MRGESELGFSATQVLSHLDGQRQRQADRIPQALLAAYRQSAAVLVAIRDPARLRPLGRHTAPGQAPKILAKDLIRSSAKKLGGNLMLAPEVRRTAIRELVESGRVKEALEANPQERVGRLQRQLEQYLIGDGAPIDKQSLDELDGTLQIVLWLGGLLSSLPSEDDVRARADYLRLLAPFEAIAGDAIFRGRRRELDQLRTYIGVLPPESLLSRLKEVAFRWKRPAAEPALSIFGPGGVGKSALIGRFMLEHTRLPDGARFPFAYLDFARPSLDVADPVGLSVEMIRQLLAQFPAHRPFDKLRSLADKRAADELELATAPERRIGSARALLMDMLGLMHSGLGPRPYAVVLDTFEEVQYRGEARAFPFWDLLADIATNAPFLRVIIAGRAPVTSLALAGLPPRQLEVGDLDSDAGAAFLAAEGVADQELAKQLVRVFGGVPLSLKLVASLVVKSQEDIGSLAGLGRTGSFLASLADEVVQGQLYERILDRIANPQVRRLAHPGLVLRRITPDVILHVLNGPCSLEIETLEQAEDLFSELQRETSLVTLDDSEGALVHRADLRRVMLKLLTQAEPARVEAIRRAAVGWYASQSGRRARAEELYHRLQLGEEVPSTALVDSEVRSSIQASLVELPTPSQLYLATLGFQVSEQILKEGSQGQQDAALASQIEDLLPYGPSSLAQASRYLEYALENLHRPSPLYRAAARVTAEQGDSLSATRWIEQGLEQSVASGSTLLSLGLFQEKAWLQHRLTADNRATMRSLLQYANRHNSTEAVLQHALLRFRDTTDESMELRLARVVGSLLRITADIVWSLIPAFADLLATPPNRHVAGILDRLRTIVLTDRSPFRIAEFQQEAAQAALYQTLNAATDFNAERFGAALRRLCVAWPHRVLFVSPPIGRRGGELHEALA